MANKIISFRGKRVVFGLEWDTLPGEKDEAAELRDLTKKVNAAYSVRFASQNVTMYGFLSADDVGVRADKADKVEKVAQYVSASMLLATVTGIAEHAIWYEIADGEARLAALENGAPSPSGDFYGSIAEAEEIIRQLQKDSEQEFTFYGQDSQHFADQFIPLTLEKLLEGGDLEESLLVPSKKGSGNNKLLIVLLAVILAGGAGFQQYQKYAQAQKLLELQRKQQQQNPEILYKQALEKALPTTGVISSESAEVFITAWQKQEVEVAGWRLASVVCAPDACEYKWNIIYGTNDSLAQKLGTLKYEFSASGKELKYKIPAEKKPQKVLSYEKLPNFSDFMRQTGSFMQDLAMIKTSVTLAAPVFFAADAGINMSAVKSPVKFGGITIVTKLALLKEIIAKLPDNVTFKKLTVDSVNDEITFTLEGNYYVKD